MLERVSSQPDSVLSGSANVTMPHGVGSGPDASLSALQSISSTMPTARLAVAGTDPLPREGMFASRTRGSTATEVKGPDLREDHYTRREPVRAFRTALGASGIRECPRP